MPVDHDRKLLFIHIPKTGGTTVLTLLGLWRSQRTANLQTLFGEFGCFDLQHLTLLQTKQFLTPPEFARLHKFAFVRNPWDRVVSAALWRTRFRDGGIRDLRDYIDWTERVDQSCPRHPTAAFALPQSRFVIGESGGVEVNRVGRFENFSKDLEAILGAFLTLPRRLPHKLRHDARRIYRDYYTDDLQRRVAKLYAEDAFRFGYTF